jgi:glycosyltransferase involved in cell wall biosynthesis
MFLSDELKSKKIALVHDWLIEIGGAEKVLKAIHDIFPNAKIFVLFHDRRFTAKFLPNVKIVSSKFQRIYEKILGKKIIVPFLPLAVESLDLSGYDLVISTGSFVKGLILHPETIHVSYCHSPTRQFWDWQNEYRIENHKLPKKLISCFQHFFRIWDRSASNRVDHFIANSENVKKRIKKYYQRNSAVIYPPVEMTNRFNLNKNIFHNKIVTSRYFLIVSRLFGHKNIDIAISAFNRLNWPLIIIGDGPDKKRLEKIANKNVFLLGYQTMNNLHNYFENCSAFILPQEEDFGIAPIEALSYGKPVLALKRGGALEYIQEGINGEFFEEPREEMLADGARRIFQNLNQYDSKVIKKTAKRFSQERFNNEIIKFLDQVFGLSGHLGTIYHPKELQLLTQSENRQLTF